MSTTNGKRFLSLLSLIWLAGCAGPNHRYYISEYEYRHGALPPVQPADEAVEAPAESVVLPEPCFFSYRVSGSESSVVERVLVTPEREEQVVVAGETRVVETEVLVREAREVLKVVPAVFDFVDDPLAPGGRRKIVVSPARTERVIEPAEYKTLRHEEPIGPSRSETVRIPAVYTNIVTQTASPGSIREVEMVCDDQQTPLLVRKIQRALKKAGFAPGAYDGVVDEGTREKLLAFQLAKGLAPVGLSVETLRALGVEPPPTRASASGER